MVANGYIIQLSIVAAAAAAEKLLVHRAAGCSVFFSSHPWLLGRGMKKKKKATNIPVHHMERKA